MFRRSNSLQRENFDSKKYVQLNLSNTINKKYLIFCLKNKNNNTISTFEDI